MSNNALELFLALAWPKKLSNNTKRCLQPQQPRSNPKPGEDNNPKLTMRMVATLHSPKTGEKSDSQTWTKEKHKHRPPALRGTGMHRTLRLIHMKSWVTGHASPLVAWVPKQRRAFCMRRTMPIFHKCIRRVNRTTHYVRKNKMIMKNINRP